MGTGRPWRQAWDSALYGSSGFFRCQAPRQHFRTSVTASPAFAAAVRQLAGLVDEALGRPDPFDLVDVGAGRGELLQALPEVPARWRLTAVERAPDAGLPGVRWLSSIPPVTGLLLANEWLDDVPLEVLDGDRLVLVRADGSERSGPPAPRQALAWAQRWWPGGGRVEVGLSRDRAWATAVAAVRRGAAVAADYGHVLDPAAWGHRFGGRRPTLTGYRHGRQVSPVPDGTCDVTAHVALDSCAQATGARLLDQRSVLRALGVTGELPVWAGDAAAYATGLEQATSAATLLDPAGLGGFGWLIRTVGIPDLLSTGR